jgi:ribonuclease HI
LILILQVCGISSIALLSIVLCSKNVFYNANDFHVYGVVGAGGILLDHGGNAMFHYAWGLGTTTNNIAEAYALYEGLKLAKECNISQLLVFGDSMLIVGSS